MLCGVEVVICVLYGDSVMCSMETASVVCCIKTFSMYIVRRQFTTVCVLYGDSVVYCIAGVVCNMKTS